MSEKLPEEKPRETKYQHHRKLKQEKEAQRPQPKKSDLLPSLLDITLKLIKEKKLSVYSDVNRYGDPPDIPLENLSPQPTNKNR